jgi:ketosteroid isomerase-like protein
MEPGEVRSVVAAYFDCVNTDNWDGLSALFHEDAESRPVDAPRLRGREAVLSMYPEVLKHWVEHLDDPVRVLVSGDTAAVDIHFTGTLPNGRVIEFDAVDVIEVEAGLIRRISYWYDAPAITADILQALG